MIDRTSFSGWLWLVMGAAFVSIAAATVLSFSSPSPSPAWVDSPTSRKAPPFALERLNGETFDLRDHRGEVVVLNFWATWCPPCREEIPDFVTLQRELGDEGLQFVGVALERDPNPETVRGFAAEMNINYPVGLGDGSIARKYGGVRGLPMTFVIGPEGRIRGHIPGRTTEARLRPALERLLEETP